MKRVVLCVAMLASIQLQPNGCRFDDLDGLD